MKNRTNSCKKWLAVLLSVSMLPTAILQNGSMAYAEEKKQEEEELTGMAAVWDYLKTFLIIFCVVFAMNKLVYINAVIPSESMQNTIMKGDRVLGNRLAYIITIIVKTITIFYM